MSGKPLLISAEVILKSKSDLSIVSEGSLPTSENVEKYYPSKETINDAVSKLRSLGFDVSPNAISLTISGKLELFEKVFDTKVGTSKTRKSTIVIFNKEPRIPSSLENAVEKIVFSPPVTYLH